MSNELYTIRNEMKSFLYACKCVSKKSSIKRLSTYLKKKSYSKDLWNLKYCFSFFLPILLHLFSHFSIWFLRFFFNFFFLFYILPFRRCRFSLHVLHASWQQEAMREVGKKRSWEVEKWVKICLTTMKCERK
jgi:hypothetical protein